jgi:hypothetical protein
MVVACLTTTFPTPIGRPAWWLTISPLFLVITLVMLVWGVTSEALRDIITRFLNEVRFD